jgi:carbon-monoxide dehydrogenase medium subunit
VGAAQYTAPESLEHALSVKAAHGAEARIIAGGTDLILRMRDGVFSPELLIDLRRLPLAAIAHGSEGVRCGAFVTLSQILADEQTATLYPALVEACRHFAGPPIRNRATLGGNIVNASPAADLVPPLMAYDADIVLASSSGSRVLPLAEFFTGPGQTVMEANEILTQIRLPPMPDETAATFIKLGQRRSMAISIVNVAARLSMNGAAVVGEARIVLGAVAPTPLRAMTAEAVLTAREPSDELIDQAALEAGNEASPISDVRADQSYRKRMTQVLVRRALTASRMALAGGTTGE